MTCVFLMRDINSEIFVYNNTTDTYGITTKLLQITTEFLQPYYSCTTGLQTVGHYSDYRDYRFRGKVPWFADVRP